MRSFDAIIEDIKNIISPSFYNKKVFDKDVADTLGISSMNFATMKRRGKIPLTALLDFCAKKSISINWLLYDQAPESLIDATNKYFHIKYFAEVCASAGGGGYAEDEEEQILEVPMEFLEHLGGQSELKYIEALKITGDSMEPTFSYGDTIFINTNNTNIFRAGVYVIRTESGLFIKRIIPRIDGKVEVISDNDIYSPQILMNSELEAVGRVVAKFGAID